MFILYSILASILYVLFLVFGLDEYYILELILFSLNILFYLFSDDQKAIRSKINLISPSNVLLFGLLVVNLQIIIDILFGLGTLGDYIGTLGSSRYTFPLLHLSLLSITSYLLGAYHGVLPRLKQARSDRDVSYDTSLWMFLMTSVFFIFLYKIDVDSFFWGRDYARSGAFDRKQNDYASFETLLNVLFVIYVSVRSIVFRRASYLKNKKLLLYLKSFPLLFWVVFISYLILRAMSGDRGFVIYNLILLFFGVSLAIQRRVSTYVLLFALFLGVSLTVFLGITRSQRGSVSFLDRIEYALDDFKGSPTRDTSPPTILSGTQELARSVKCNYIAMDAIQGDGVNYTLGRYSLFGVLTSLPGSYTIMSLLGVNPRDYLSAEFITINGLGHRYDLGLGTSAFAEFYLEFGILGLLGGFYLLGWLFKVVDHVLTSSFQYQAWVYVFVLSLSSISIYIPRHSFAQAVGTAIYAVIIFLLISTLASLFFKKNGE